MKTDDPLDKSPLTDAEEHNLYAILEKVASHVKKCSPLGDRHDTAITIERTSAGEYRPWWALVVRSASGNITAAEYSRRELSEAIHGIRSQSQSLDLHVERLRKAAAEATAEADRIQALTTEDAGC